MNRMFCDDLQTIPCRNRSPPRSPFLATLLRRQSKNDHSLKIKFKEQHRIVVLGAAKVGKSSIIQQFLYDQFSKRYNRTIEDLYVAEYNLSNGASLRLEILDTTGYYQFPAMRALSISNGNAFLLVYSLDDEASWKHIEELRHQVCFEIILKICMLDECLTSKQALTHFDHSFQIIYTRGPDVPIVIAGNKSYEDIERTVSRDMVEKAVKRWRCGYIECNAKGNINIVHVFERVLIQSNIHYDLSEAVCRRRRSYPVYSGNSRLNQVNANTCSIT